MKAQVIGLGWVTPFGRDLQTVYQSVLDGRKPATTPVPESNNQPVYRIPTDTIKDAQALPRLRRSSAISHFAVAAAIDAVAQAGLTEEQLARTTLIFTASDGGVIYTRRFYGDIVDHGPGAGSPLLFPETVYNAPASHVAGTIGLSGEVLTLVGDSSTTLSALHIGAEALQMPDVDFCLIVAAQEMDWISAEAYDRWGLINGETREAACFSEGAAAIVLARNGRGLAEVGLSHPGLSYGTSDEVTRSLLAIFAQISPAPDLVISSTSGTHFDQTEQLAYQEAFPGVPAISPKMSLGDALSASSLQHVILGTLLIHHGVHRRILIPVAGFNGQASALLLTDSTTQTDSTTA